MGNCGVTPCSSHLQMCGMPPPPPHTHTCHLMWSLSPWGQRCVLYVRRYMCMSVCVYMCMCLCMYVHACAYIGSGPPFNLLSSIAFYPSPALCMTSTYTYNGNSNNMILCVCVGVGVGGWVVVWVCVGGWVHMCMHVPLPFSHCWVPPSINSICLNCSSITLYSKCSR